MRAERQIASRRALVKTANDASRNAKRSSIALDLEFEIIKNGSIYRVTGEKMVKKTALPKVAIGAGKSSLTKGSRICLK